MKHRCKYCGKVVSRPTGEINRAIREGKPLYCDRKCSGLARRSNKTPEQKKMEKSEYDERYRERNADRIREGKREYHKKTYDPAIAAVRRKALMPIHVEYCREPEYKEWKKGYDRNYRARKQYGDFGETFLALMDLEQEVSDRTERTDIYAMNGTLNKKQTRRREYEQKRTHGH